jgi:hypothetical protein
MTSMQSDDDAPDASPPRPPLPVRTSEVLRELAYGEGERVSFRDILTGLRHRAFGFTMLIFALPACLPMPPGIPTVCGIALTIIALNLIAARRRLWLPSAIADKSLARADLRRVVDRVLPMMQRLERLCRPRLATLTEPMGKVLIGVVVLVLGLIMILPIPLLGNMPPGAAAAVIAIGVTERDGLVVLVGLVVSALAVALAGAAAWAAILAIIDFVASS